MKKTIKILALIVVVIAALTFSACAANDNNDRLPDHEQDTVNDFDETDNDAKAENTFNVTVSETDSDYGELSVTEMLEKIRPTVVDIRSYLTSGISNGSGVIIGKTGDGEVDRYFIVTNHHVINGGSSFDVSVLSIADDGSESHTLYDATLVGSAPSRDIAVLSVRVPKDTTLSEATFIDDSDKIKVGTEVFAIGNPLGILGGTVTHGIISAKEREIYLNEIGNMTLMQTDAAINGGNSGGGLFDSNGTLVGIINSQYESYNDESIEGLNFAIPANDAKFAAVSLIETYKEDESGNVINYGYIEGDTRLDVAFRSAMLYDDETLTSSGTYLLAGASAESGPFYEAWGMTTVAVRAMIINDERTEFSNENGTDVAETAENLSKQIEVGDKITIEYSEILSVGNNPFFAYNYLSDEILSVEITATQYIYGM